VRTRQDFAFIVRVVCVAFCLVALMMMAGCGRRTVTAEEGEMTCAQCHLDRELLKADLKADPPPEPVKAENEGEG
jgi:hypothetical protein